MTTLARNDIAGRRRGRRVDQATRSTKRDATKRIGRVVGRERTNRLTEGEITLLRRRMLDGIRRRNGAKNDSGSSSGYCQTN